MFSKIIYLLQKDLVCYDMIWKLRHVHFCVFGFLINCDSQRKKKIVWEPSEIKIGAILSDPANLSAVYPKN